MRTVALAVAALVVLTGCNSGGSASAVGDPLFADEWHLENTGQLGFIGVDLDVTRVWASGDRGAGTTIAVVDDGLEIGHEDLRANVVPDLSYDYVTGGTDPTGGEHGTAVAGIIAERDDNGLGGRGVAPRAGLVGYNALYIATDADLEDAMVRNAAAISVSNNSWGNPDGTGLLQGAPPKWQSYLDQGLAAGRGGRGTVYVWAAGNGASEYDGSVGKVVTVDNANYDGFANAHGVIAVCSTGSSGKRGVWTSGALAGFPYSEAGANLWVCAPGGDQDEGITTTDRTGAAGYNGGHSATDYTNPDYTKDFEGTSAAAAMVSGVVALMLSANPSLGWRDVPIILARTARMTDSGDPGWRYNAAGYHYNSKYGFGLVDADQAVALARKWTDVGAERIWPTGASSPEKTIPDNNPTGVSDTITVANSGISHVEWVAVTFRANDTHPGHLEVSLIHTHGSTGTISRLAVPHDCPGAPCTSSPYSGWVFGDANFLGEPADGVWTLKVVDTHSGSTVDTGAFQSWRLKFYGH